MVDTSNVTSKWVDGVLTFTDLDGNTIMQIHPSSGGVKFANAGGITVSTGVLAGLTVSSGLTLDGVNTRTVTTAYSLVQADSGRVVNCAVTGTFVTLPLASTTSLAGTVFTLRNSGSTGAAQIILITTTTESIIGGSISTTNLISNTLATADTGDYVSVSPTGSSSWRVTAMVGTWASTT